VFMGREHGPSDVNTARKQECHFLTPVFTGRVTRAVNAGSVYRT